MNSLLDIGSGGAEKCLGQAPVDVTPSMLDTLKAKRDRLLIQVSDLEAAMKALEQNPGICEVLELIRKVNRF